MFAHDPTVSPNLVRSIENKVLKSRSYDKILLSLKRRPKKGGKKKALAVTFYVE